MLFLSIQDQLNEIDGEFDDDELMAQIDSGNDPAIDLKIKENRKINAKKSQKRSPNFSQIEVDANGTVRVESVNIKTVTIKYYTINAELLFSCAPFMKKNTEGFSYVKPFFTVEHQMFNEDAEDSVKNTYQSAQIAIPDKLKNQNIVIEVTGADI